MSTLLPQDRQDALKRILSTMEGIPGAALEIGVYRGGILAEIAKTLPDRTIFGFDTFAGLPPEHWNPKEFHRPGEFATSGEGVRAYLNSLEIKNVRLIAGLFPESASLVEKDLQEICFAHVDVDFYQGTIESLRWIYPRLSPGGAIVIDDYGTHDCPEVKRAVDELASSERIEVQHSAPGQAWIQKPNP